MPFSRGIPLKHVVMICICLQHKPRPRQDSQVTLCHVRLICSPVLDRIIHTGPLLPRVHTTGPVIRLSIMFITSYQSVQDTAQPHKKQLPLSRLEVTRYNLDATMAFNYVGHEDIPPLFAGDWSGRTILSIATSRGIMVVICLKNYVLQGLDSSASKTALKFVRSRQFANPSFSSD